MDVDIDNYDQIFRKIEKSLEKSKLISLDLEFSGIKSTQFCVNTDTPFEQFEKRKEVVQNFNIIQFGITIFTEFEKNSNCYYYKLEKNCQDLANEGNKKNNSGFYDKQENGDFYDRNENCQITYNNINNNFKDDNNNVYNFTQKNANINFVNNENPDKKTKKNNLFNKNPTKTPFLKKKKVSPKTEPTNLQTRKIQKKYNYKSESYNFYLFPQDFNENIKLNTSTMKFLNKHESIDYNKWIKKGITYVNNEKMEELTKKILMTDFEIYSKTIFKEILEIDEKKKILNWVYLFKIWLFDDFNKKNFRFTEKEMKMKKFFVDEILNSKILEGFKGTVNCREVEDVQRNRVYFDFFKSGYKEKKNFIKFLPNSAKKEEFEQKLGFKLFWEMLKKKIIRNNISVVGHNLFIDLMYMFHNFEENIENVNYLDFKEKINKNIFPIVYDTKLMAGFYKMSYLNLDELKKEIKKNMFFKKKIKIKKNFANSVKLHQAGIDTYIVGFCFLNLVANMGLQKYLNFQNRIKLLGNSFYQIFLDKKIDKICKKHSFVIYLKNSQINSEKDIFSLKKILVGVFKNFLEKILEEKQIMMSYKVFCHQMIDKNFCFFIQFYEQNDSILLIDILKMNYRIGGMEEHWEFTQTLKYIN